VNTPHPICTQLRDLRVASNLSLAAAGRESPFKANTLRSYETGERGATVERADEIARFYGYRVALVPVGVSDAMLAHALEILAVYEPAAKGGTA
jgi:transcriptional regulator with XRE-family HTH domain